MNTGNTSTTHIVKSIALMSPQKNIPSPIIGFSNRLQLSYSCFFLIPDGICRISHQLFQPNTPPPGAVAVAPSQSPHLLKLGLLILIELVEKKKKKGKKERKEEYTNIKKCHSMGVAVSGSIDNVVVAAPPPSSLSPLLLLQMLLLLPLLMLFFFWFLVK